MRNKDFEERVLAKEDMKDVDYLLTDYYSSMQTERLLAQLAKMTEEKKLWTLVIDQLQSMVVIPVITLAV